MKNLITKVFKNKIMFVLILLTILFTPQSLYLQEINKLREIVTCIGIDKTKDGVELSILHIVPKSSSSSGQNIEIATATGDNMADVLNKISLNLGKIISFAHCDVVLVSNKIMEEGITKYLDFLMRKNNLTTSALVVGCEESKKTLETIMSSKILASQSLRELIEYNNKFIFTGESSVENFYQSYFSESELSFLPIISVSQNGGGESSNNESSSQGATNESSGNSSSANSDGSSSSGQSAEESGGQGGSAGGGSQDIANNGNTYILKRGKKVLELNEDAIQLFNLLSDDVNVSNLVAKDFVDGDGKVKTISTETSFKDISRICGFINDKPVVHYNIELVLSVDEIEAEEYSKEDLDRAEPPISKEAGKALKQEFERLFASAVNLCKSSALDLFRVEKYFNRIQHKSWQKYLQEYNENKFENILFSYELNIVSK